jgi:hypothetical protein
MQNSADLAGSRKRLYVTTAGVLKYETRDSTGTVRDDVGSNTMPTDTEIIVGLVVVAGSVISLSYAKADTDAVTLSTTSASGLGTLTGLNTMSVGGALVGGVTADCTKGYIRAFAYWPTGTASTANAYRLLRAAKYFAPVAAPGVDPLILAEVANGAAAATLSGKTVVWASSGGQLFARKDSGMIVGL